jgi:1-acyl-sn-glycerol-3-phosphate acyltransferase
MRGMDIILRRSPVPVIPVALKGLWGSYFSRHRGKACKGLPNRFWSRLEIEAGAPVEAAQATADRLQQEVTRLRGDFR